MRILFLSGWYPYPANNGSKLRIYNLLRGLASQHDVTLITFVDHPVPDAPPAELMALCRQVHAIPRVEYNPRRARALLGFFTPTPRVMVDTYAPEMEACIRRELKSTHYDLIIASEWGTAAYWPSFGDVPTLFEDMELGAFEAKKAQSSNFVHRARHQLTLLKLRSYLRRTLPRFATATVVSETEAELLRVAVPGYNAIEVLPNCINLADYQQVKPPVIPNSLIFTGSFRYSANYEAMTWFLQVAYPLIQAAVPDVQLTITGDHANLPLPTAKNVHLTGYVDDIRPLLGSAAVSIVPIRVGGGTRLKILEAMALRTPVVATSKGAEGLDALDGEHLMIADTPQAFAEAVIRVLRERHLGRRLGDNAYQLVRQQYDWAVVMPRFMQLIDSIVVTPGGVGTCRHSCPEAV